MGSTTRRTPVTFKVPKNPDYKYNNIVDFGGLNITDNPLTAPTNTASDMLNVYVDEENALTTRPRLEKKYDYYALTGNKQVLKIYSLVDGFLIHCKSGSTYYLYLHKNNTLSPVTDSNSLTPNHTFSCFENNEIIYIIDGVKYLQIKNTGTSQLPSYTLTEVEGYIPTAKISVKRYDANNNTYFENGVSLEPLNLLNDKYIEKQFWDGKDVPSYTTNNLISVENNYYSNLIPTSERLLCSSSIGLFLTNTTNGEVYKYVYDKQAQIWNKSLFTAISNSGLNVYAMASNTGRVVEYDALTGNVHVYDWSPTSNNYTDKDSISNDTLSANNKLPVNSQNFSLSDDGKIISFYDGYSISSLTTERTGSWEIDVESSPKTATKITTTAPRTGFKTTFNTFYYDPDNFDTYMVETMLSDTDGIDIQIYKNFETPPYFFINMPGTLQALSNKEYFRAYLLDKNTLLISARSEVILFDISQVYPITMIRRISFGKYHSGYSIDRENNRIFVYTRLAVQSGDIGPMDKTEIWVYDLNDETSKSLLYIIDDIISLNDFYKNRFLTYTDLNFFVVGNSTGESLGTVNVHAIHYKESNEPELTLTYNTTNLPEENSKRIERRAKFLQSTLTKRWNNEQWFASGATLFRTVNNDPTYVSLTSFTELGNSNQPITGFNVAQDDLFLVYKNDNLYSVQYGEVLEDTYDYLYTETKNNVGNDAPGNCIVSVLTEMPLQVSYDGIYALNQLKNVATSDRVCMPISESINPKWLKETKKAITNCITLNRLYWTYFILVYKRSDYTNYDKDYDFVGTKVYLLDNRSGQWYYWELPIITINAFSKDNKTYFVDEDGVLYTLETSDIINKYNNEVTEYYDEGEKLISWKWVSQIMPLGTINYSKRLIDTTFILTDTDATDEFGLMYKFKSFRKMASQTGENTISNKLNYIQSITKKTLIPRCNFIQLELSNIEDDLNNNKLRLVGLGFRYVLLEGLY